MKKTKAIAKMKNNGKYITLAYGTEFEGGGTQFRLKPEMLDNIIQAINDGELELDNWGYIKFNVYEDKTFDKKGYSHQDNSHAQQKQNGYQKDNIPF